jgi:hypothetical protein
MVAGRRLSAAVNGQTLLVRNGGSPFIAESAAPNIAAPAFTYAVYPRLPFNPIPGWTPPPPPASTLGRNVYRFTTFGAAVGTQPWIAAPPASLRIFVQAGFLCPSGLSSFSLTRLLEFQLGMP